MEIFLIKLLQFILSISLLVLLHEGGHALASKLFGVKVEKFFIFFDVSIGKWSGKLFSFKPKGSATEYGMGWLPLGGYCKIAGMIDESMEERSTALGVSHETGLAAPHHHGRWRNSQLPARSLYLFDDHVPLGRELHRRVRHGHGYEIQ